MREDVDEFDIFVPSIMFLKREGSIVTAVTWADAAHILLPRVDQVLIMRDKFRVQSGPNGEFEAAMLPWAEVERAIAPGRGGEPIPDNPLNALSVTQDEPSEEIVNLFRRAPSFEPGSLVSVDPAEVFESEIIEEMRRLHAAGDEGDGSWKDARLIVTEDRRN